MLLAVASSFFMTTDRVVPFLTNLEFSDTLEHLKVRTRYNILNFPALFLALVGLPFCPPGRYYSTASAEKSTGKFKIFDFEIFSPEIHALGLES